MRDCKPKASPGVIQHFMDGIVYQDFINELITRIESFRDLLEYSEEELNESSDTIRGAVKNARQMLNIFEDLKNMAIQDQENKN